MTNHTDMIVYRYPFSDGELSTNKTEHHLNFNIGFVP